MKHYHEADDDDTDTDDAGFDDGNGDVHMDANHI